MSQLTLSKLRALLADLHAVHGNLPVEPRDADTCRRLRLPAGHAGIEGRRDAGQSGIMANHGDERDGALAPSCRGGDGAGE